MAHIWVIKQLRVGDKWCPWFYTEPVYSRKRARRCLNINKEIFPNYKFRIKKYIREDG